MNLTVHPSQVKSLLLAPSILLCLLLISGTPIGEALRFSIVFATITFSGGILWQAILGIEKDTSIFEFNGMGIAIGSALSSISQFILKNTTIDAIAWSLPAVVAIFILLIPSQRNRSNTSFKKDDLYSNEQQAYVFGVSIFTLTAMAAHWYWLYPITISLAFALLVDLRTKSHFYGKLPIRLLIFSIPILISIYISTYLRDRNPVWKILSYDLQLSESLSWSLRSFGPNESPFLVGTAVKYHWFSLFFSGTLTTAANGASWTSITRVMPIISYIAIICLLITFSIKVLPSPRLHHILWAGLAILFLSNPFGFSSWRWIASPTFMFSCVWMLALLIAFVRFDGPFQLRQIITIFFLTFFTFGAKVTSGAVALSGLLLAALIVVIFASSQQVVFKTLSKLIISLISVLLVFITVFLDLSAEKVEQNKLDLGIVIAKQVGIIDASSSYLLTVLGLVIFFLATCIPLVATISSSISSGKFKEMTHLLIMGAALSGILLTIFTVHVEVSQLYFYYSAIVIASAATPLIIIEIQKHFTFRYILLFATTNAITTFVLWKIATEIVNNRASVLLKLTAVLIGPIFLFAQIIIQKVKLKRPRSPFIASFTAAAALFVPSSIFLGGIQRIDHFVSTTRSAIFQPQFGHNMLLGTEDQREVLNWMRRNTAEHAIIATNRFCIPGIDPCNMKWMLVSALSHRRMLIEGGYSSPTDLYGSRKERYENSVNFGSAPNAQSLRYLCDNQVSWYFYDHFQNEPPIDWSPFATIRYSNESASLLELNCGPI